MAQHTSDRGPNTVRTLRLILAVGPVLAGAALARGQATAAPPAPVPSAAAAAPVLAPTPPAVEQIEADLDQKQYGAAVRDANKLLAVHAGPDAGYSRFQVTMLKGDALIGNHAVTAGKAAYRDALHETHDPHEVALATWTTELFRRAKGTTYVPHVTGAAAAGGGNAPIDLVDRDSRKAGFAALLEDELSVLGPDLKQAAATQSLVQIMPAVKRVQALAELDGIANGSDARTAALAGGLLEHARNLMSNALKGMWTRIGDISTAATAPVTQTATAFVNGLPTQQATTGQTGLSSADANELRGMIDTCHKILEAADTFAPLSSGTADKDWGAIQNDAGRVGGRARDVLNANYSSTSTSTQYPTDGGYNGGYTGGTTVNGTTGNGYYPTGGTGQNGTFPNNNGGVPTSPQTSPGGTVPTPSTGTTPATPTPPTTPTTPVTTPGAPAPQPSHPGGGRGRHGESGN